MHEAGLKGFNLEIDGNYTDKMEEVLKSIPVLTDCMNKFGIALGISSKLSLELDFDDADELKDHPVIGKFLNFKFNDKLAEQGATRE